MRMVDCIEKKVEGGALSAEEIQAIVHGFTCGSIPDYQMSALMMAIVFAGMDDAETEALTLAMMHSGEVCDLSDIKGVKVDKHSTGGVGDTTTLIVGPLVAACGGTVAKMSGRGLGHTGGTLDKLESIPHTVVEQPLDSFKRIVNHVGIAVIGQTANLDPADKKMYALRDVTGTVGSIPLIVSSIMSKKLASGANAIVLDVKTGSGAFMRSLDKARELSTRMVRIGSRMGKRCIAVISDMNQPLGLAVGNALEVRDAVLFLSGKTPPSDRLYEVCMCLGTQMLLAADLALSEADALSQLTKALHSGAGLSKLQQFIAAQNGDASYLCYKRIDELCRVNAVIPVASEQDGYIARMETEWIGTAAQMLGAGRATLSDVIDPAVGIVMKKRLGDPVKRGEPICQLYVNDTSRLIEAQQLMLSAVTVSDVPVDKPPVIYDIIR